MHLRFPGHRPIFISDFVRLMVEWELVELFERWYPVIVLSMVAGALVAGNMAAGYQQSRQGNGSLLRLFLFSLLLSFVEISPLFAMVAIVRPDINDPAVHGTIAIAWLAVGINLYQIIRTLRSPVTVPKVDQPISVLGDPGLFDRFRSISQKMKLKMPPAALRIYHVLNPQDFWYAWLEGLTAPIVVVADVLVLNFERDEVDAMIAHELAHVVNGSMWVHVVSLPFSLFVTTVVSAFVPWEVALSLAFAMWTGICRSCSRWLESDCDRRAGLAVGSIQMAAALQKFDRFDSRKEIDWIEHVGASFSTHPHRDVRVSMLLKGLSTDQQAETKILFSPQTVQRQIRIATVLMMVWLTTILACLAVAWGKASAPWACLPLLGVGFGPLMLESGLRWRSSRYERRRMGSRWSWWYPNALIVSTIALSIVFVLSFWVAPFQGHSSHIWVMAAVVIVSILRGQRRQILTLLGQVRYAIQLQKFEQAIELLNGSPQLVKLSPHLQHDLALVTSIVRTRAEAIEILETLRESFPSFKYSWFFLSTLYLDEGDAAKALQVAKEIAASLPHDPYSHLAVASAERQLRRLDQAQSAVDRAVQIRPELDDVKAMMAGLCLDRGDEKGATELIEQVLKADPFSSSALVIKSQIMLRTRPIDEAREFVEQLIARLRTFPRHHFAHEIRQLEQELAAKAATAGSTSPQ